MKPQRARISVWDKTGIVEFARELAGRGIEILSTAKTAKLLNENGIKTVEVSEFTGSPEVLVRNSASPNSPFPDGAPPPTPPRRSLPPCNLFSLDKNTPFCYNSPCPADRPLSPLAPASAFFPASEATPIRTPDSTASAPLFESQ